MTAFAMGSHYIKEARGRIAMVETALHEALWAAAVKESQECVELFLKGALRLVGVEPARTHDVAEILRRESERFPSWFQSGIGRMASISTELDQDRSFAFYGDHRQHSGPRGLLDESAAARARDDLGYVADCCGRLLAECGDLQ